MNLVTGPKAIRVLIVEDEVLLSLELEDLLTDLGHEVVGQATRMDKGLVLAREIAIDLAILDVNVAGSPSFPIADILRQRGIPFLFATGYGAEGLLDGYRHEATLGKPYDPAALARAVARVFGVDPVASEIPQLCEANEPLEPPTIQ